MIGSLIGQVKACGLDWVLVQTTGGVGYKISVTHDTISRAVIDQPLELVTHLVVREDQLTLYGFPDLSQLNFFVQLIGVSGVGPRMALAILNAGQVKELSAAIAGSDVAIFTTIAGIGKKTAERIIVELKNKMATGELSGLDSAQDLMTALTSLGYNTYEIRQVLPHIPATAQSAEERIKHALKLLGK
jgi:holliday junction DNA helicase RuvA